jgi:hypothetical protein
MTDPAMTTTASPVQPGDWAADPAACTLTFAVRNFGLRPIGPARGAQPCHPSRSRSR